MESIVKVGDILAGTWGYTMTIPCFYVVTKVTPKGVKVIELRKYMAQSTDGPYRQQGYEIPRPGNVVLPGAQECLARYVERYREYKIGSRYDARYIKPWDGKPVWANYCD